MSSITACTAQPVALWQRQAASPGRAGAAAMPPLGLRRRSIMAAAPGGAGQPTPQQRDASSLDVSGAVVQPAYRSTPWQAVDGSADGRRAAARVALVSESGICRGPLAAAAVSAALARQGLSEQVECECRATQSYCVGEEAHPAAAAVAAELGLPLPDGYTAQQFKEARDIVEFDVVLVVDKFTAADVLREVSVYDTIKSWGLGPTYSSKVRRLGEFNPAVTAAAAAGNPEAGDIEDPLYGNVGGEEELAAVRAATADIQAAAEGFAAFVAGVARQHAARAAGAGEGQGQQQAQDSSSSSSSSNAGSHGAGSASSSISSHAGSDGAGSASSSSGGSSNAAGDGSGSASSSSSSGRGTGRLGDALVAAVRGMEAMSWMVPPMLQPR